MPRGRNPAARAAEHLGRHARRRGVRGPARAGVQVGLAQGRRRRIPRGRPVGRGQADPVADGERLPDFVQREEPLARPPGRPDRVRLRHVGLEELPLAVLLGADRPVAVPAGVGEGGRQGRRQDRPADRRDDEQAGDGRAQPGDDGVPGRPPPAPPDGPDRPRRDRLAGLEPPQVVGQGGGRRVPVPRVLPQALQADGFEVPGAVRADGPDPRRVLVGHLPQQVLEGRGLERHAAGDQFVQGHPEGVHVRRRADVGRPVADLLRRGVRRRAQEVRRHRQPADDVQGPGQAEVGDLRHAGRREQDVVRLQVPVDDPLLVRVVGGPGDRFDQPGGGPRRLGHPGRALLERAPVDVLQGEVRPAGGHPGLENLHDVRVLELGDRFRLQAEPDEPGGRRAVRVGQEFDGHDPVQREVPGRVHDPHAAAADLGQHVVPGQDRQAVVRRVRLRHRELERRRRVHDPEDLDRPAEVGQEVRAVAAQVGRGDRLAGGPRGLPPAAQGDQRVRVRVPAVRRQVGHRRPLGRVGGRHGHSLNAAARRTPIKPRPPPRAGVRMWYTSPHPASGVRA